MTTKPNPAALLGRARWLAGRLGRLPNGTLWGPDGDANYIARVTAIDSLAADLCDCALYPAQLTVMDGRAILRMGGVCTQGRDLPAAAQQWVDRVRREAKEVAA
jgi:hypothetical protein